MGLGVSIRFLLALLFFELVKFLQSLDSLWVESFPLNLDIIVAVGRLSSASDPLRTHCLRRGLGLERSHWPLDHLVGTRGSLAPDIPRLHLSAVEACASSVGGSSSFGDLIRSDLIIVRGR